MSGTIENVLEIKNLYFNRRDKFSIFIKNVELLPGTITCIVGPNGSGKTTLIELVLGLIKTEFGTVKICQKLLNFKNLSAKKLVGYIPDDEEWIIPELTAKEYFSLLVTIFGRYKEPELLYERIHDLSKRLYFTDDDKPMQYLSHGNRKKIQIIAGLFFEPKLVVIDELRNGLDPIAIRSAETIIKELADKGSTILAATHDLWWAERFANEAIFLVKGRILKHDPISKIQQQFGNLEKSFFAIWGRVAE